MNLPLISVILPIYNVEKYLCQCLDSISKQTYKNIEIIAVIDGAQDNSYTIARDYAKNESRLKVVWQENAGSGPARNKGLVLSTGDYIAFVDPDDWVKEDYIEVLYQAITSYDVDLVLSSKTDNIFHRGSIKKVISTEIDVFYSHDIKDVRQKYLEFRNKQLLSAPTQKLFKKKIITLNNVQFPDLRRSQDIVFNYRYYDCIKSIAVINYSGYQYRVEQTSYALRLPENYIDTIKLIYNDIKNMHKKWNVRFDESQAAVMSNKVINSYIESLILRGKSLDSLFVDKDIIHIVEVASPSALYERIIRSFILSRSKIGIKYLIYLKRFIKSVK